MTIRATKTDLVFEVYPQKGTSPLKKQSTGRIGSPWNASATATIKRRTAMQSSSSIRVRVVCSTTSRSDHSIDQATKPK